jgi:predicted tellurium resistance membrane protein TerC
MNEGCFAKESDGHLKALDIAIDQCVGTGMNGEELLIHGGVSGHFLIVLFGGGFILYTAIKEIMHMIALEEVEKDKEVLTRSPGQAIFWIVVMNLVFSFDSILAAIPLTKGIGSSTLQLTVMGIGIVISGTLMIVLADTVSEFLKKNRMYEVLGLFILFLVGVMLITEAGHLAHLKLLGHEVHAMNKSTFYFVLIILVLVDVAQSRYQKKLNRQLQKEA